MPVKARRPMAASVRNRRAPVCQLKAFRPTTGICNRRRFRRRSASMTSRCSSGNRRLPGRVPSFRQGIDVGVHESALKYGSANDDVRVDLIPGPI